jgi:hypothetical protein
MPTGRSASFIAILPVLLFTSGCLMRVGPKTIRGDRFDYSAAISSSWKTQMMMNLVRIRYMDPPVFLDIAQVVASYTLEASAEVQTPDYSGPYFPYASVTGRWAESPTITYNPLTGEKFTKSLLAPVSPISIFQLVQAGWPLDAVFAIAVKGINGLHAANSNRLMQQQADPRYYRVLRLLRELQQTNSFSIRTSAAKEGEPEQDTVDFTRLDPDDASLEKAREVRKLLGLNQEETSFKLAFGAVQASDKELALLTRSILEIITEASVGVEIPDSDLKEGRATQLGGAPGAAAEALVFRVHVRSSTSKPGPNDAFAAAQYHGHWFWVDDRDLQSKRGLGFLMVLATLAEAGTSISPPVLSISKP